MFQKQVTDPTISVHEFLNVNHEQLGNKVVSFKKSFPKKPPNFFTFIFLLQNSIVILRLNLIRLIMNFFEKLFDYIQDRTQEFDQISEDRKTLLSGISDYVRKKIENGEQAQLVCICTHNSRRSHFAQIWSQVAALHFGYTQVKTYSGGTEATAFNPSAVNAVLQSGFVVDVKEEGKNPVYLVKFNEEDQGIECFSKVYDHETNPQSHFCAIMTCSDADENCPFIPGVEKRVSATYYDPKISDGTPDQEKVYGERCAQIAREMLFVFSRI